MTSTSSLLILLPTIIPCVLSHASLLILQQNLMNNFRIFLISHSNVFVRLSVHNQHSASSLSPHFFKCIFNATKFFFKSWTLSRNLWNNDLFTEFVQADLKQLCWKAADSLTGLRAQHITQCTVEMRRNIFWRRTGPRLLNDLGRSGNLMDRSGASRTGRLEGDTYWDSMGDRVNLSQMKIKIGNILSEYF